MKQNNYYKKSALFSEDRKFRFMLYREWSNILPSIMFIGLNPSVADSDVDDPTIRRIVGFAKSWGYGSVYMMNCFAHISTDPKHCDFNRCNNFNCHYIRVFKDRVSEVVFCWGNNNAVQEFGILETIISLFPNAKVLEYNKNGSPKHPLYIKAETKPIPFINKKT